MSSALNLGAAGVDAVYVGATKADAVYLGGTMVWAAGPLAGVNIGDAFMGGYYAGIIDTTKGNIIVNDASQTGLRYALIVAGISLESTSKTYKTTNSSQGPAASFTRWDGLTATAAMNSSTYPAAQYCAGLSHPSDNASAWYLPAMDELELIYRNLKCSTESNSTATTSGVSFPGTQQSGYNPSSDPPGAAYTSTAPGQTTVAAFQSGGSQALGAAGVGAGYWSATDINATLGAWFQFMSSGSVAGWQTNQNNVNFLRVRPVRRLVLT